VFIVQVPTPPPTLPLPEIVLGGGPDPRALIISLVAACVMVGMIFVGPVGRAIADGIRHILGARRGSADTAELEAVRAEVAALQHRLGELEERQDFAERLLAQARERGLLAGPGPG
jgi:hypothetical protein